MTTWRTQQNTPRRGEIETLVEMIVTNLRSQLSNNMFDALWAEGQTMELETAVSMVLTKEMKNSRDRLY